MLALPSSLDEVLALPFVDMAQWNGLPDQPGIYFAIIDREHLVYIGITGVSLRRRWRYHNHRNRLQRFGQATVAYMAHDDADALYEVELEAIRQFDPVMNDTPGFLIVMEDVGGTKRFYRKTWDEVRPIP